MAAKVVGPFKLMAPVPVLSVVAPVWPKLPVVVMPPTLKAPKLAVFVTVKAVPAELNVLAAVKLFA